MKKRRKDRKKDAGQFIEKKKISDIWIKGILLIFIFLRFFFDGISEPYFNYFWNFSFFFLFIFFLIKEKFTFSLSLEELFFLLFFTIAIISSGLSDIKYSGADYIPQFLSYFCFLFLFIRIFKSEDNHLLWCVIMASGFLVMFYGLYQHFFGLEETRKYIYSHPEMMKVLPPTFFDRMASGRIFSRFVYPNIYASFLLMIFPFAFFLTFQKEKIKILSFILLILTVYSLFLTGSIGGIFTLLFIIQIMFFFIVIKDRKKFWIVISLLIFIEIIGVIFGYKAEVLPHFHSLRDRLRYWSAGFRIIKENFLLGVGAENFKYYFLKYKSPGVMEAKHAHNLLIEVLSEQGFLGFLFISAFFLIFLIRMAKCRKNLFTSAIGFSFLAGFLHNMMDFDFYDPAVSFFLFILAGWGIINCRNKLVKVFNPLTKIISYLIILIVIFTGILNYRFMMAKKIYEKSMFEISPSVVLSLLNRAEKFYPFLKIYATEGDIYYQLGLKMKDYGYISRAEKVYRKAIGLNPHIPQLYRKLAFIYEMEGKVEESEKMYLKMIESYPEKKQYNIELALFYKRHNRMDKFRKFYERSKKLPAVSIEESKIVENYEKWIELQK